MVKVLLVIVTAYVANGTGGNVAGTEVDYIPFASKIECQAYEKKLNKVYSFKKGYQTTMCITATEK